ncbi:Rne/Rng family ribonuclease [Peribacillus huizhouensis]|uniref:Ribonuclease G n=1 Tax=Peribacillus huizhouensis TaxID=1501239 RepID=A0ABR6CMW4_9BACI|nr:Rne/Rng family ribonuclease [Peribacillus huizhouensis]MBA9025722.1 ribonuclease G [Peribacillus huizhouensis]
MKKLIANLSTREKRYACIENGRITKLEIEPPKSAGSVGNIYLGKVTKVLPGMEAAFIDYGEKKSGFLYRDELPSYQEAKRKGTQKSSISQYIREGEKLLVQVTRDEAGTKGAKLTGLIELSSNHVVYIHGIDYVGVSKKFKSSESQNQWRSMVLTHKKADEGLIIRTAMEEMSEAVFLKQLETQRENYAQLLKKATSLKKPTLVSRRDSFFESILTEMSQAPSGELYVDDFTCFQELKKWQQDHGSGWEIFYEAGPVNIFSHLGIESEAEQALKKFVWLKNGSYLIFEETEAFTVVDVNTGKFTGKAEKEQTLFETNMQAAKEIAHQLRLRNIGGIILIDFINMKQVQHHHAIVEMLKTETKQDEMRVQLLGFTELGIFQLTRKRTSASLSEKLTMACPMCLGTGKVDSAETVAFRLERELMEHRKRDEEAVLIETNEAVSTILFGEQDAYKPVLEEMLHKEIVVMIVKGHDHRYEIKRFGTKAELMKVRENLLT